MQEEAKRKQDELERILAENKRKVRQCGALDCKLLAKKRITLS
jgi:hypothetical protein